MKRQKRRTLSTAVIAAVLSLGLAGAAWAQSPPPAPIPPHHMKNFPQFIEKNDGRDTFHGTPPPRTSRNARPAALLGAPAGFHLAAVVTKNSSSPTIKSNASRTSGTRFPKSRSNNALK